MNQQSVPNRPTLLSLAGEKVRLRQGTNFYWELQWDETLPMLLPPCLKVPKGAPLTIVWRTQKNAICQYRMPDETAWYALISLRNLEHAHK